MMNKITVLGFFSMLSGVLLLGYQGLAYLMDVDNQWHDFYLGEFWNYYLYEFSDHLPFAVLQTGCEFIINGLPFYQLLMGIGLFLILIGAFIKN